MLKKAIVQEYGKYKAQLAKGWYKVQNFYQKKQMKMDLL